MKGGKGALQTNGVTVNKGLALLTVVQEVNYPTNAQVSFKKHRSIRIPERQKVLVVQVGTKLVNQGGPQTMVVAVINTSAFVTKEIIATRMEQTQEMHVFVATQYVIFRMVIFSVEPMEPVPKLSTVLQTNILLYQDRIINVKIVFGVQQVQQDRLQSVHALAAQTNT